MKQIVGYDGKLVWAPDTVTAHEQRHPAPNIEKYRLSMLVVDAEKPSTFVETHAGFGMLSACYLARSMSPIACIEADSQRFLVLQENVGQAAVHGDCRARAAAQSIRDADVVDIDPYDWPDPVIRAHASEFRRGQILLVTTSIVPFRFHMGKLTFRFGVDKRFDGLFLPALPMLSRRGDGLSEHVVVPWINKTIGGVELMATTKRTGGIERVALRVTK